MKAAIFEETGLAEDVLKIKEIETPEPGPGEIRIKVSACNINPSDVMFVQGMYGIRPQLPAVGGFEAAGVIDKCGEDVSLPTGMRVIFTAIGVWQEYVILPAKQAIPAPEGMSDEMACQAFVNPFTAYGMLDISGLKEGQFLLLTAGGSAFSKFVTQMAASRGIKVISAVRRDDLKEELKSLGAFEVINTETQDSIREVRTLTGKNGVDYVFEAVGGKVGAISMECLKLGGTMMVYGLLSLKPTPMNNGLILFKNLTIKGFWLTTWITGLSKEEKINVTKNVFGSLTSEQLKISIDKKYKLDEVVEAIKHSEAPGRKGKIILDLT